MRRELDKLGKLLLKAKEEAIQRETLLGLDN